MISSLLRHAGAAQAVAAACLVLLPPTAAPAEPPSAPVPPTLFVHVNLVPMDSPRVLHDESVLVQDGRIAAIGPALSAPVGSRVVDGHGTAYLLPGLADMHVHADTSRDMAVFLANGVTTVLNMGEARNSFMTQTRSAIDRGDLPGPQIYAGFLIDGTPEYGHLVVTTADEARALVRFAKSNGYDFIKVYNNLAPECFEALIEEGRAEGVPVIGHGVTRVGIEKQLAAGQLMVAHAEEYLYTVFFPPGEGGQQVPDPAQIPRVVGFTKRSGAFVTADLGTYARIAQQWGKPAVLEDMLDSPHTRLLDPDDRIAWRSSPYARRQGSLMPRLAFLETFVKALSDGGVPLIAGTDTPAIPGQFPGISLHDDLDMLLEAGLTRYQALAAATRTPGEFIRAAKPGSEPFGTVTPGARADLLLSAGNPLGDLDTLRSPLGVMKAGRWYDADALRGMTEAVAAKYQRALAP